jgi:hypothetical protein
MKRCGNAPKGSKQHRLNVSGGSAESTDVSSVHCKYGGDGGWSYFLGRIDGISGEISARRKCCSNFASKKISEKEKRQWRHRLRARQETRK